MGSGLSSLSNFVDAAAIVNIFTGIFSSIQVTSGVDFVTMIIIVMCIGWAIHSIANKEP